MPGILETWTVTEIGGVQIEPEGHDRTVMVVLISTVNAGRVWSYRCNQSIAPRVGDSVTTTVAWGYDKPNGRRLQLGDHIDPERQHG